MFSFFSKRSSKDARVLIIDIRDSSVGAAMAYLTHENAPTILYSVRERVAIPESKQSDLLERSMHEALGRILARVQGNGPSWNEIDAVHVTFSSLWYHPHITTLRLSNTKPAKVTRQEIDEHVREARRSFEGNYQNVESIEGETLEIRMNGYNIDDPFGKKTDNLEIDIFTSVASSSFIDKIEQSIGRFYAIENIHFHTFSLSSYSVIRGIFSDTRDYLIVDIGGDVTDVSMVQDSVLVESGSIPLGTHDVPRKVAESRNSSPEEAMTHVTMAEKGDGTSTPQEIGTDALQNTWKTQMYKLFDIFTQTAPLPDRVFFCVDADLESVFARFFSTMSRFDQEHLYYLDNEALTPFVAYGDTAKRDFFLSLAAIYTHMYRRGLE